MSLHHFSFLAVSLLLGADASRQELAQKELERFQGDWVSVSYTVDGKPATPEQLKTIKLTVKGATSTFQREGQMGRGIYNLEPTRTPKEIDVHIYEGPEKGKVHRGIYEFDGQKLLVCLTTPGSKDRPRELVSKPGSGHTLEVWQHTDKSARPLVARPADRRQVAPGSPPGHRWPNRSPAASDVCGLAAKLAWREGPMAIPTCAGCIVACKASAVACEKCPDDEHMKTCARGLPRLRQVLQRFGYSRR